MHSRVLEYVFENWSIRLLSHNMPSTIYREPCTTFKSKSERPHLHDIIQARLLLAVAESLLVVGLKKQPNADLS